MYTLDLDIIGTHLSLRVESSSSTSVDEDFSRIRTRFTEFENRFSRFIPENWLHRLNQDRKGILDADAKNMLICALDVAHATDGYFDPTVGKRLRELGYGNPDTAVSLSENVFDDIFGSSNSTEQGDYHDILVDDMKVVLEKKVELEFGGVGKWYLLDVLHEILESYPKFLINFWGDLGGKGGWRVGLESPFASDEIIGTYVLDGKFLACSAGTKRKWGNHHHLINPKTGESASDVVATYIESDSGMIADAYATALSVMPWEKATELLEKNPQIEWVLIRADGSVFCSRATQCEVFR